MGVSGQSHAGSYPPAAIIFQQPATSLLIYKRAGVYLIKMRRFHNIQHSLADVVLPRTVVPPTGSNYAISQVGSNNKHL